MILEIGFLVVSILIVSLYAGFLRPLVQEPFDDNGEEGSNVQPSTGTGYIDLAKERDSLIRQLDSVQIKNHDDPANPGISSIRVGLERLIGEVERALEEEGRYVKADVLEAIIRASHITFRPT